MDMVSSKGQVSRGRSEMELKLERREFLGGILGPAEMVEEGVVVDSTR